MAEIDALFAQLVALGGSDLHLSSGRKPLIRESGEIKALDFPVLDSATITQYLQEIMPQANRSQFDDCNDTDFAYEKAGVGRFRANIFRDRDGMGGVFRVIPSTILSAEQLNLPKTVTDLCNLSKGLVVVTGPTGSGKSTTQAAMIDYVNLTRSDHIITVEDPIEFVHHDKKCLINQREVHNHTQSFASALRAALREDPDIVLVGEMRDLETIEIAIRTAETGHLVFGTLHTNTAASTVDRIIEAFPADRQNQIRTMLASSLKGVVAQTLCKRKTRGRVAALEIMIVTRSISSMIRDSKTFQIPSAMQVGGAQGMVLLNNSLTKLVKDGVVEPQQAYDKAVDKEDLLEKFRQIGMNASAVADLTAGPAKPETREATTAPLKKPADPPAQAPRPAGQTISNSLIICGESFKCWPLAQACLPAAPEVYVILGVDQWGAWSLLDVGQTDEPDGDKDADDKRRSSWTAKCPTKNLWFGHHVSKDRPPTATDRLDFEKKICDEHNPPCKPVR
ncbi:MAG: type IV pilus twitching motility protein PilT [bacterium]